MKKLLLPVLILLAFSTQALASLRQTQYRWRNNDGNETTATWKAAANTPINVGDTSILRLRLELNNDNTALEPSSVTETLEYSSDNGVSWTVITNAATNAFHYTSSTLVTDGGPTTNQMGTTTFGTFVSGRIISAVPTALAMLLNDAERTEFEWVIKPTVNVLPMTKYLFRSSGQEDVPVVLAELNTTCVGVYVLTKKDSARCGPGIVGLSATGTAGTTLKWYDQPNGGTALSTGNTFTTPLLTSTKTYYVTAALGTTCESARTPVIATIHPIPAPDLGSDRTICEEDNLVLNPGSFNAYLWDNGAVTPTRTVTTGGTYVVTVTGTGNCKSNDTVQVHANPKPVVSLGNDTAICPGSVLLLDAGNPDASYIWSDGLTTQTRPASAAGDYEVTVTNAFGCKNTDLIHIIIKDAPKGNINAVHGDTATYTFDVLQAQFAVGYIWNFGDGAPEETGFSVQHRYESNGIYQVRLTILGDCDSVNTIKERTVDVYDADAPTNIGALTDGKALLLYPNPASDVLAIDNHAGLKLQQLEVYNILGQLVLSAGAGGSARYQLSTASLTSGIYTLRIGTDKGTLLRKFEIRR